MNQNKKHSMGTRTILILMSLMLPTLVGASLRYFKDDYPTLQKKAVTLQSQGSMAGFNTDEKGLKGLADAKRGVLDSFYGMASSYGKTDVDGANTVLKNEARLNWNAKQLKKPLAFEALYCAEASIKFFLDKDKAVGDPNRPALMGGYENAVLKLVGQGEAAFAAGKYVKMRNYFYHALWIAYPVTSKAKFTAPKD